MPGDLGKLLELSGRYQLMVDGQSGGVGANSELRVEIRYGHVHTISADYFQSNIGGVSFKDSWIFQKVKQQSTDKLIMTGLNYNISREQVTNVILTLERAGPGRNHWTGSFTYDSHSARIDIIPTQYADNPNFYFREIDVYLEAFTGRPWPPSRVSHNGAVVEGLKGIYKAANISVNVNYSSNRITPPPGPLTTATLHSILDARHPKRNDRAPQMAYLMIASRNPNNSLGIMYDSGGQRQREGAAVFVDTIMEAFPNNPQAQEKSFLRTTAHELGHMFNLLHPNRKGTTIMNQTGVLQQLGDYPNNIRFDFRHINNEHMAHHLYPWVLFGGKPFGSDPHNIVLDPIKPDDRLHISIILDHDGDDYDVAQPIHLTLQVTNVSRDQLTIDDHFSPAAGICRFYITDPNGKETQIHPVVSTCVDANPIQLNPGEKLERYLTLFIDRDGPIIQQSGQYKLRAEYLGAFPSTPIADGEEYRIVQSDVTTFYVSPRLVDQSDIILAQLSTREAKLYFNLLGGDHLQEGFAPTRKCIESISANGVLVDYLHYVDSCNFAAPFFNGHTQVMREKNLDLSESAFSNVDQSGAGHAFTRFLRHHNQQAFQSQADYIPSSLSALEASTTNAATTPVSQAGFFAVSPQTIEALVSIASKFLRR